MTKRAITHDERLRQEEVDPHVGKRSNLIVLMVMARLLDLLARWSLDEIMHSGAFRHGDEFRKREQFRVDEKWIARHLPRKWTRRMSIQDLTLRNAVFSEAERRLTQAVQEKFGRPIVVWLKNESDPEGYYVSNSWTVILTETPAQKRTFLDLLGLGRRRRWGAARPGPPVLATMPRSFCWFSCESHNLIT